MSMEEKKTVTFRKTIFESIPTVLPITLAVVALAAGAGIMMQPCSDKDLALKYAFSAICVAAAGIIFSFYVYIS